jgi:hypothetical protein
MAGLLARTAKTMCGKEADMDGKPQSSPSRRRVLARAAGAGVIAAAAIAAETLGRPAPAAAANGDPVVLGQSNTETAPTQIHNTTDDGLGLACSASGSSSTAAQGFSADGVGVRGFTSMGAGVQASADNGTGVSGTSISGTGLTIRAGAASAAQPHVGLSRDSIVLVTPQNNVRGLAVRCGVQHPGRDSFTVHLARPVRRSVTIGWFVVN